MRNCCLHAFVSCFNDLVCDLHLLQCKFEGLTFKHPGPGTAEAGIAQVNHSFLSLKLISSPVGLELLLSCQGAGHKKTQDSSKPSQL